MINSHPFLKAYEDLYKHGIRESPRDQTILELENYSLNLHPINDRFTSYKARNMNLDYAKFEILWYLRGDRFDVDTITDKAQMWKNIIDIDGGINSNYGQYIFRDQCQIKWVIDELKNDKSSRRAVMTLLNHTHLRDTNPDIVCTYSIGFRIRDNKLNMTIHMRSWDAIWGMTNDIFCFSIIYELVYNLLKMHYHDLQIGNYYHTADSFHVYERHFEMLENIVKQGQDGYMHIDCPAINKWPEAMRLLNLQPLTESDAFSKWLKS